MDTHTIKVPDVGEGVAEVELVAWTVAVGDQVARDQVLAEVMTDKANVEIPAPVDGVVADLQGGIGEIIAVGTDLIRLTVASDGPDTAADDAGTETDNAVNDDPAPAGNTPAAAPAPPAASVAATSDAAAVAVPVPGPGPSFELARPGRGVTLPFPQPGNKRAAAASPAPLPAPAVGLLSAECPTSPATNGHLPRATPAVRRRARDLGIDLAAVAGSGPDGRVTHADLDRYLLAAPRPQPTPAGFTPAEPSPGVPASAAPPALAAPASTDLAGTGTIATGGEPRVEQLVGLRRQIAQRMVTSTTTIPHITYVEEVDVTAVEELRATLNAERADRQPKLTLLPFLIKAMTRAIGDQPEMNAHVDDAAATVTVHGAVHVGIATQTDRGLMVPVVGHAEGRSLWALATEIGRVSGAARDRSASVSDLTGSTITISSLGALGGVVTTPVINKPEVAIVGVNKIETRPVWNGSDFTARRMMNLSSSFDHRVIDGFDAATFVQRIRVLIEQPALLFLGAG